MTRFDLGDFVKFNPEGLRVHCHGSKPGRKPIGGWENRLGIVKGFSRPFNGLWVRVWWAKTKDSCSTTVHISYLEKVEAKICAWKADCKNIS